MVQVVCPKQRISWRERVAAALTTLKSHDFSTVEDTYAIAFDISRYALAFLLKAQAIVRLGRVRELKLSNPHLCKLTAIRYALTHDRHLVHRTIYKLNRDRMDQIIRWLQMDEPRLICIWEAGKGPKVILAESGRAPDVPWNLDDPMDCPD